MFFDREELLSQADKNTKSGNAKKVKIIKCGLGAGSMKRAVEFLLLRQGLSRAVLCRKSD